VADGAWFLFLKTPPMGRGTPEPSRASTIMSPSEQLTISIASKDRPEVVEATLRKLHEFGLGDCPLILCDDGSIPALDPPALRLFPLGRLLRNETAQGQASVRNRIAFECGTPYLFQLDDDSYPVAGNLAVLLQFAEQAVNWLAIAIPFEEPARGRGFPTGIPRDHAVTVKSFVGCSVLFQVSRLRQLGGYARWIGRTVEEEELSLRALAAGYRVLSVDLLRIRHEVSNTSRDPSGIAERSYRNWLLMWLVHAPWQALPWRVARLVIGAARLATSQRDGAALMGLFAGFRLFASGGVARRPVTTACYRLFRRLPHALDFFVNPRP
jgi:GT2 family glycosyltransferase